MIGNQEEEREGNSNQDKVCQDKELFSVKDKIKNNSLSLSFFFVLINR